jgi:hypothetical protein
MPNWVYNRVRVFGAENDKQVLYSTLTKPHPVAENKQGELTFHNVFSPTDVEAYKGIVGTSGKSFTDEDSWYGWNIKHWGTKWDVCEANVSFGEYDDSLVMDFETAWSPPEPIIYWLIDYCQEHNLDLYWDYEEEQGWGGAVAVEKGVFSYTTYDIPSSHKDYKDRGITDGCVCGWSSDPRDWVDDCPNKKKALADFDVVAYEREQLDTQMNWIAAFQAEANGLVPRDAEVSV